jgi:hypothetical protein
VTREEWRKRKLELMRAPAFCHANIHEWLAERERKEAEREQLKELLNGNGGPVRYCDCPECVIGGKRTPALRFHDCVYVKARSELVKVAVARTSAVVDNSVDHRDAWTKRFNLEMERLAAPLLRKSKTTAEPNGRPLREYPRA